MGLIRTGIQVAGGYAMVKTAAGAMEKHDQNKYNNQQQFQQQYQQPGQFNPQSQPNRAPNNGQTYGKYIAPDGTEYPVYQPQPQFQGSFQPVPLQFQNQASRSIEHEPSYQQTEQRSIAQGDSSPPQSGYQGYHQPPTSSTPPPYQHDRKA